MSNALMSRSVALFIVAITRSMFCPTMCCLTWRLSDTFRCRILLCFSVVIVAVPVTGNVLACLPTPSSALTFVIIAFTVASVATFWSFLSLHCHPHRRSLPRLPSYTTTFHRFRTTINPRFVHFYLDCHILSRFLSSFVQSLSTLMSFVCLHYHHYYHRVRSLHRCPRCFRRCIADMSSLLVSCVVKFRLHFHSNQPKVCLFALLCVVTCHQFIASSWHLLTLVPCHIFTVFDVSIQHVLLSISPHINLVII